MKNAKKKKNKCTVEKSNGKLNLLWKKNMHRNKELLFILEKIQFTALVSEIAQIILTH